MNFNRCTMVDGFAGLRDASVARAASPTEANEREERLVVQQRFALCQYTPLNRTVRGWATALGVKRGDRLHEGGSGCRAKGLVQSLTSDGAGPNFLVGGRYLGVLSSILQIRGI